MARTTKSSIVEKMFGTSLTVVSRCGMGARTGLVVAVFLTWVGVEAVATLERFAPSAGAKAHNP